MIQIWRRVLLCVEAHIHNGKSNGRRSKFLAAIDNCVIVNVEYLHMKTPTQSRMREISAYKITKHELAWQLKVDALPQGSFRKLSVN